MHFDDSEFLQVGWCGILGYWIFIDAMRVVGRDPGCFTSIGVYSVCYSTESISIYVTLFVLMIQASFIRIVVPGMSIFVNESVRPSRICVDLCFLIYFLFNFCEIDASQILYRDGTANAAFAPRLSARTVKTLQTLLTQSGAEGIAMADTVPTPHQI
jgi:hypothetical protein